MAEDVTRRFDVDEDEVDPWAWVSREGEVPPTPDLSGHRVTAVLVAMDAGGWLAETLDGLAGLQHRPTRLIAIDNASADNTGELLHQARDRGLVAAVYPGRRSFGFGQAVTSALEQDAARPDAELIPEAPQPQNAQIQNPQIQNPQHWLWLLHDDAVPAPDALQQLLIHVAGAPEIDLTGPKLVLPKRRQHVTRLSEVGATISGTGRRELLLDPGEIDQGQRDEPAPRLGVSTCGMLVRREVWRSLGGLDPALPVFRDGVELGWRAHLAGYRVLTTPKAQMTHRQVGRAGLRPHTAAGRRPGKVDRQLGMLAVAGHASRAALPLVWLRLVGSALAHAIGHLLGKVPRRSLDEMLALGSFLAHPGRIREFRRRLAATPPAPGTAEVVKGLRPPWWSSLRLAAEAVSGAASSRYRAVAGEAEVTSIDELTGDDFAVTPEEQRGNPWLSPVVITVVLCVLASLVAARGLLGPGSLAAPALLPAPETLGALWRSVETPIPGAPGQPSPPWLALVAVGSTLVLGRPEWLVTLLVCAVVPLTLLSAYPVVRHLVDDRRVRLWAALTYALLPVLLGATNQGRLALSMAALVLPILVLAVRAIVLRRPRAPEALRGGWGAGVVLVVLVAFEPSMIILAVAVAGLGALALRRTPRKVGRIALALGVPLLVLAPWWPGIIRRWGRLLVGPDAALDGVPAAPAAWELLLGRGLGPGLPPLVVGAVVFGCLWLVAIAALVRRPGNRLVRAGWLVAVVAFGLAVLCSRLVVVVPPVDTEVRPWVGAQLLTGFGALIVVGAAGVEGLGREIRGRSFSWRQPGTVVVSAVVGAVTLLGGAWWVWAGATGPVERTTLDGIPPYVRVAMLGDTRVRALAVDLSREDARYAVVADDQLRLGDADRGFAFGGSATAPAAANDLVVRLVAGTADSDITPQLRDLGIGYLWVAGASEEEQARIDNTPGLGAASGNESATVWQLQPAASRAVLVDPTADPPTSASVPSTAGGTFIAAADRDRELRVGEAVDPRWEAQLDGIRLRPVEQGWQQAFVVPARAAGTLTVELRSRARWLLLAQGVLLLVALILAAPAVRRPEVRDPTRSARRAATLGGVR
jgi:GT2 family glycosyltransferase